VIKLELVPGRWLLRTLLLLELEDWLLGTPGLVGRGGKLATLSKNSSSSDSFTIQTEDDVSLWRVNAAGGNESSCDTVLELLFEGEAKPEFSSADHRDVTVER
jgi:hypothetical protein